MKLSVVIVNYNVKYFLEQCLHSVRRATQGIEAEVFVVDNNSVDGSVRMLSEKFPEIKLIVNSENKGFSKANNQALVLAKGEFVLLLNPDTVVEDDTFSKIINFMHSHPEAGGLGVKMVDGKGRFLPESKRGLPTPSVAFYKIFGLSRIFPKSRLFGQYHLTFLDKNQTHEVEILSGAFMLLRRNALEKTGLLDETYFMYGEDIDLSYRLIQAGYKNYYFPEARIIHYKGESTKKSSINYLLTFYYAMIIFARKHFTKKSANLLSFLIHIAIWLRAGVSIAWQFMRKAFLPLADATLLYAGILLIKNYWEENFIYLYGGQYPKAFMAVAVPIYILIWLLATYFSGGYDKPVRLIKILQGLFFGTVTILVFYALLSEAYRFSRALIILGAVWGLVAMVGLRLLLHLTKAREFRLGSTENKRYLVVGDLAEASRVADLMRKTELNPSFIGLISTGDKSANGDGYIGSLSQIYDIIPIYEINEVIFCAKDLPARQIIDLMSDLSAQQLDFKIAPPESLSIIGSNSISTSGDLYMVELNSIAKTNNRRNKRLVDVIASMLLILIFPLAIFVVRKPLGFIKNTLAVLFGFNSWVGYCPAPEDEALKLPAIKQGVLNPTDIIPKHLLSKDDIFRLNILYARNYEIGNDVRIIVKGFRESGR